jgi:hypothetical protein
MRTPPIDWTDLPLAKLLSDVVEKDARSPLEKGELQLRRLPFAEVAWQDLSYLDPNESRPARSRTALARGGDVHAVITFDCWAEDAARFEPIWDALIASLELARYVEDPGIEA